MLSVEKMEAKEILKKEYYDINRKPIINIGLTVGLFDMDNYFRWRATMVGPRGSPYIYGIFYLEIIFPENYPNSAPDIIFITPIYHLNVNPNKSENNKDRKLGYVNLDIIKKRNPEIKIRQIFIQLYSLFYFHNTNSSYGMDIAMEYKFKRALYEEKAKYFTEKYVYPINTIKIYDKSWDFSYDDSDFIPDENQKVNKIENESYKYDSNDNEKIILIFDDNGRNEIEIECQMNELTRNVIHRCIDKLGISKNIDSDQILIILNGNRIILDNSIRKNGFRNNSNITIIYDFAA